MTTIIRVNNFRTAEATKPFENIFRSVNISLINELNVIYLSDDGYTYGGFKAAKTKAFGFMPKYQQLVTILVSPDEIR